MKKSIRHVALLLLIVIVYPFVFQTFHIIHHDHGHSHANRSDIVKGRLHAAHHDKCDNPAGKYDNSNNPALPGQPGQQFSGSTEHHNHEEAHCPLCEHEFAKFSLSTLFHISFTDERVSLVNNYCYRNPHVLYSGNHRSLRAPPLA